MSQWDRGRRAGVPLYMYTTTGNEKEGWGGGVSQVSHSVGQR